MEASELVKEVVNNDSTKELINFLREEMSRSREHELKMIQLLTPPHLGSDSFHSGSAQYTASGPVSADYRAFLPNALNRPGWPEGSFSSLTPTYSMSSASNETSNLVMALCFKIFKTGTNYISLPTWQSCSVGLSFHSLICCCLQL